MEQAENWRGVRADHFEILRILARGSSGKVLLVVHMDLLFKHYKTKIHPETQSKRQDLRDEGCEEAAHPFTFMRRDLRQRVEEEAVSHKNWTRPSS